MADANTAWKHMVALKKAIEGKVPAGFGLYMHGAGNKEFLDNIDPVTGFWTKAHARHRWIIHVEPADGDFLVRFPAHATAIHPPASPNITNASVRKNLLGIQVVTLVRLPNGSYEWPVGWQWTLGLTLADPAPIDARGTSVSVRDLDLKNGRVTMHNETISVADWVVIGLIDPDDEYLIPGNGTIRYGAVGERLTKLLALMAPVSDNAQDAGE